MIIKTPGKEIFFPRVVVKAQVLVGGRGKAGGIKIAENKEELENIVSQMLGSTLKGRQLKKCGYSEIAAEKKVFKHYLRSKKLKPLF
jgi:succinyl-CoA synthetase beta subunit